MKKETVCCKNLYLKNHTLNTCMVYFWLVLLPFVFASHGMSLNPMDTPKK